MSHDCAAIKVSVIQQQHATESREDAEMRRCEDAEKISHDCAAIKVSVIQQHATESREDAKISHDCAAIKVSVITSTCHRE